MARTKKKKISRKIDVKPVSKDEFVFHLYNDFSPKHADEIINSFDADRVVEYRYGARLGSSRNVFQVLLITGGVKTWYSSNKKVFF